MRHNVLCVGTIAQLQTLEIWGLPHHAQEKLALTTMYEWQQCEQNDKKHATCKTKNVNSIMK